MRSSAHSQQEKFQPKRPGNSRPMQWCISIMSSGNRGRKIFSKSDKKKDRNRNRNRTGFSLPRLGTEKRGADINTRPTVPVIDGRFVASYGGGYRMGRLRVLREECDVSRPLCIDKHFSDQSQAAAASMMADHPLIGHHYRSRIK